MNEPLRLSPYSISQLRQMPAYEVAMAFVHAGGWQATKRVFLGDQGALGRWKGCHPEFRDPRVASLLESGKAMVYAETVQGVSQELTGTDASATILGLTDDGQIKESHIAGYQFRNR